MSPVKATFINITIKPQEWPPLKNAAHVRSAPALCAGAWGGGGAGI